MQTQHAVKERGRRSAGDDARARLLDGLPVTERRITLAGVSTAVLVGGEGPPVVLLHGGVESGGVYWAPVISRLARSHRLIVPDVPGLGESEPVGRIDAEAFDNWFTQLLAHTCDERPTLIAHSLLGSYAARFAAQRGDLLQQMVIYGAPGIGRYRMPLGLLAAAIMFDLSPSRRNQERFERWAFLDPAVTRRRDPEWLDAFDAYCVSRGGVPHVKRTMRQLVRIGTQQIPERQLGMIAIPTALFWGRHDRMIPLNLAQAAARNLGWPLHVIEDAGHVPHIEQPVAFTQTLLTGLLGLTPSAAGRMS